MNKNENDKWNESVMKWRSCMSFMGAIGKLGGWKIYCVSWTSASWIS